MKDSSTFAPVVGASSVPSVPSVRRSTLIRALPPNVDSGFIPGLVRGASVGVINVSPVSNTGVKSGGGGGQGEFGSIDVPWSDRVPFYVPSWDKASISEWASFSWESDEAARIDTLTFSFSGLRFDGDSRKVRNWLMRWSGGVLTIGGNVQRFNGYRQCLQVILASGGESPMLGWLGMSDGSDPMRGRWCLHFTGAACGFLKSGNWLRLFNDVADYEVKITRVDLAVDELSGEHSVEFMRQQYLCGVFNLTGSPPKFKFIQSSDGDTFYVGKRSSGKVCRSYEKGRQLGDNTSSWVRHEVEIHNINRVIPLDVLVNPTCYFKGAYPRAFAWVSGGSQMIKTFCAKHRIEFENAVVFAKRQVGRLVRYCQDVIGYAPEKIIEDLIAGPGRYPARLFVVDDDALDLAWG